jgi:hypothetical protein
VADDGLGIFFSYRRVEVDTAFVNRLEADLRARGYKTWVDRFRLEGGEDWRKKIDEAIAACSLFLMVLSPDAFKSDWVKYEFDQAQRLGKRLMPVVCRRFSTPAHFSAVDDTQHVDFADDGGNPLTNQYPRNLKRLLDAIEKIDDPSLDLSASDDVLYLRALDLERKNDLERAARTLQHLVDRNAGSLNGNAGRELVRLEQQLYALRAQRLREKATAARKAGQYGAEVGALQALIALGDQDPDLVRWAHAYLDVAIENSRFVEQYGIVQTLMEPGPRRDLAKAKELLQDLYDKAPFYHDPVGIAPELGVLVPKSNDQDKERAAYRLQTQQRSEAARVKDAISSNARAVCASLIEDEWSRFATARELFQKISKALYDWNTVNDTDLEQLAYLLNAANMSAGAHELERQALALLQPSLTAQSDASRARVAASDRQVTFDSAEMGDGIGIVLGIMVGIAVTVYLVILLYGVMSISQDHTIFRWVGYIFFTVLALIGGAIAGAVAVIPAIPVGRLLAATLKAILYSASVPTTLRAEAAEGHATAMGRSLSNTLQRWESLARAELAARRKEYEQKRDAEIAAAEATYRQQMAAIDAGYERTLAEIAAHTMSAE